jgi:hypothetical protein
METPDRGFLTHFTDLKHIPKILETRSILSPEKQRKLLEEEWIPGICYNTSMGIGNIQRYDKSIFLEILSKDYNNLNSKAICFIFDPKILIDKEAIFSLGWNYGKLKENNYIKYDNRKSLKENLEDFDSLMKINLSENSKDKRMEIMIEDQILLDSNLIKIYVPEELESKILKLEFLDPDLKSKICSNFDDFFPI